MEDQYDLMIPRSTVKDNIEKLVRYSGQHDTNGILFETNFRETINKKTNKKETAKVYTDFGLVHDFTQAELRLMIDSILFSKQIPSSQREELIGKLEKLTSKYFNSRVGHIRTLANDGPNNNNLFYSIEMLDEAISNSKQVSFHYMRYNVDEKSELILQPQMNKDGTPREYIINPYQMVAANGRYYLICNYDRYNNISHYRVDWITNIQVLDKK